MKRTMILMLPVLLATVACGAEEPGEVESLASAGTVDVSPVVSTGASSQVPARVVALQTANLATRGSGTVEAVLVDVGTPVRRGQVVARLEASGVESAVVRAEAQTEVARRTFNRLANLERDGAATRQELDQAEATLRSAEAMLDEARASRDYVILRAPFDGTVSARLADPGDLAVPGRPVLVISGAGGVKVQADVPVSLSGRVTEGASISVVSPEAGARWPVTVTRVASVIDPASQRFRVEAEFESSRDLPAAGAFVRLEVPGEGESSAWIPQDAVVRRGQLTGVYVAADGELRLRWVRPGRRTDGAVEILAGLNHGDLVVRRPQAGLVDGTPIEGTRTDAWTLAPEGGR